MRAGAGDRDSVRVTASRGCRSADGMSMRTGRRCRDGMRVRSGIGCCAADAVLSAGMLVTTIPLSRAASTSTTLYPVAKTPMYFNCGSACMASAVITVLLVSNASASAARSNNSSGAVRSYTLHSPNFSNPSHERSPGLAAYPSSTTIFIIQTINP